MQIIQITKQNNKLKKQPNTNKQKKQTHPNQN